jgi:anti-sigma regulatory factor (Ser/Thr protein kinase)
MPEPAAVLELRYGGDVATLGKARRDVVAWLQSCGADDESRDRATLIISELATNALQASPGKEYRILLERVDGQLASITVENRTNGSYPPAPEQWKPVDRSALRGRGLGIVRSLSENLTVGGDDQHVAVTATIRLHQPD